MHKKGEVVLQGNYENINKLRAIDSIVGSVKKLFPDHINNNKKLIYVGLENKTFSLSKELKKYFNVDVLSYEICPKVYREAMEVKPNYVEIEFKNLLRHEFTNEQVYWFDSINCLTNTFVNDITGIVERANIRNKMVFVVTYVRNGINNVFTLGAQYSPYKEIRFAELISKAIESEYVTVNNTVISVYANIEKNKPNAGEMVQVIFEIVKK